MKITVLAVGKVKEKFFRDALDEYRKRLSRYCRLEIVEVDDEQAPERLSPAQEEQIRDREGKALLYLATVVAGPCILVRYVYPFMVLLPFLAVFALWGQGGSSMDAARQR